MHTVVFVKEKLKPIDEKKVVLFGYNSRLCNDKKYRTKAVVDFFIIFTIILLLIMYVYFMYIIDT